MSVFVTVPPRTEDVSTLLSRLKAFFNVSAHPVDSGLRLCGLSNEICDAQEYALKFIGPESVRLIALSHDVILLFNIPSILRHFEPLYRVIIVAKTKQTLLIRGNIHDTKSFADWVINFDKIVDRKMNSPITSFKLSYLHLLCRKFKISYDELIVCTEPITMAMLLYLCSLLESKNDNQNPNSVYVPFVEAYRVPSQNTACLDQNCENDTSLQCASVATESSTKQPTQLLRSIVIDGSNVAFAYGKQTKFEPKGIQLAVDFFLKRGHTDVVAVVPRHRRGKGGQLFDQLERDGRLTYSSSRVHNSARQTADDDRVILQLAEQNNAVVVSNDQFRNYLDEHGSFKDLIENRVLQYTIAWDTFLIPDDPFGPSGPSLSQCLSIPQNAPD